MSRSRAGRALLFAAAFLMVYATLAAAQGLRPAASAGSWRVVSTTDARAGQQPVATIRFANGYVFRPGLFHPAVIGTLPSGKATPYLVVDGVDCTECDATARSVYVGDPRAWPKDFSDDHTTSWAISYPSRNYSASTGKLMSWSRVFFGRCLSEGPGVVSFYAARERKGWSRRVDWVAVVGDRLKAHEATREAHGAPTLAAVLKAVGAGDCREVRAQVTDEGDY